MPKLETLETSAGARRGRSRRVATSLAEINVVPLVDVMLVLLIIFMVATPMIQRGLDVNLPVSQRSAPMESERIFVTVPLNYQENHIVYLDDEPIRVDVLEERMRQALLTTTAKEVFLRGDGGVRLNDVTEVMDYLKAAGVEKVGLLTRLPQER
jgi:biopolymer transport protein TolR